MFVNFSVEISEKWTNLELTTNLSVEQYSCSECYAAASIILWLLFTNYIQHFPNPCAKFVVSYAFLNS
jgi:hypothetical protein